MRLSKLVLLIFYSVFCIVACGDNSSSVQQKTTEPNGTAIDALKIQNLLRDSLALAEHVEVVMSYLEIPKNTSLPSHYHPGEEFVYMLEGSGELEIQDQAKRTVRAGEVIKIPFKHAHSFTTIDEDAKAVVFRVHEKGQPDRILIE